MKQLQEMKDFYNNHKRSCLTIITLFSPLFWYVVGIICGGGGGAITICIISGFMTTIYGGIRVAHEWKLFEEQNNN